MIQKEDHVDPNRIYPKEIIIDIHKNLSVKIFVLVCLQERKIENKLNSIVRWKFVSLSYCEAFNNYGVIK